jgi:hypothetical protein
VEYFFWRGLRFSQNAKSSAALYECCEKCAGGDIFSIAAVDPAAIAA